MNIAGQRLVWGIGLVATLVGCASDPPPEPLGHHSDELGATCDDGDGCPSGYVCKKTVGRPGGACVVPTSAPARPDTTATTTAPLPPPAKPPAVQPKPAPAPPTVPSIPSIPSIRGGGADPCGGDPACGDGDPFGGDPGGGDDDDL